MAHCVPIHCRAAVRGLRSIPLWALMAGAAALAVSAAGQASAASGAVPRAEAVSWGSNAIFIHHSIGRNFLAPWAGAMRDSIADWNARRGTNVELWDHDYGEGHPVWGLSDADGVKLGYSYGDEFNNTIQVAGYRELFCTVNAARDSLLRNHDIIAFKPGYESIWLYLNDDAELESAKAAYRQMRDAFDGFPDKIFVIVTQPPIHRLAPYLDARVDRARALANYVKSETFLASSPNVYCFDLFDLLARPDDPEDPYRNCLRYEYELSHDTSDPHPNEYAGEVIGPVFAAFLYHLATVGWPSSAPPAPAGPALAPVSPNPFNPLAALDYELVDGGHVQLAVYDLRGRLVARLEDAWRPAGRHRATWDGRDAGGAAAPSGVYLARLTQGDAVRVRKLVLAR